MLITNGSASSVANSSTWGQTPEPPFRTGLCWATHVAKNKINCKDTSIVTQRLQNQQGVYMGSTYQAWHVVWDVVACSLRLWWVWLITTINPTFILWQNSQWYSWVSGGYPSRLNFNSNLLSSNKGLHDANSAQGDRCVGLILRNWWDEGNKLCCTKDHHKFTVIVPLRRMLEELELSSWLCPLWPV